MTPRAATLALVGSLAACQALWLAGCQEEARIVYAQPTLLQNVPGAVGGLNPDGTPREGPATRPTPGSAAEALAMTETDLIKEGPDGRKVLVAKIIQHTIIHLVRTLRADDDELLYDQVISQATKDHLLSEGRDPREAIEFFKENRDDIIAMLSRMSAAENTPGVIVDQAGKRNFRLRITGTAAKGLRFTEYWVTLEKGNWRVLWVS